MDLKEFRDINNKKEELLSAYATKTEEAVRLYEEKEDARPAFFHDTDRVINAMSYTRYIDKTQVFSYMENDHISKRIIHVQLVSKIARTIGRFLKLNEDLIEAISLGHDIGHTPLGHFGESCLNEIFTKEKSLPFMHNIQSVRTYLTLDNNGNGSNLTIQTLDGIMCHNGEMLSNIYRPKVKNKKSFLEEYEKCLKDSEFAKSIVPMTLEGCVVRISDLISYLGRDIEDAIRLKKLERKDIPKEVTEVLGETNKEIVNTIILDIVRNSYDKPYIKLSDEVFNAMNKLKDFNYQNIYNKANTSENMAYYKKGFRMLYDKYLKDLMEENQESIIYKLYLSNMSTYYIESTEKERIVIDFIAGMTDDFFMNEYNSVK